MWPGLGVFLGLIALRVALNYSSLRNYLKLPLVERVKAAPRLPSVSIVVPARDEERNLPALLQSLKALDYAAPVEVIVVDDGSTDGSAEVARGHGAQVVAVDGPPHGWKGKPFACWSGAQAAANDWLLFTDADTTHEPKSLDQAVRFALQRPARGLSLFLQQRCGSFWERILLPYAYQQYFVSVPYRRVNLPRDPEALANGQYILVEREAYFQAGGHAAVKAEVLDDVALATHFKAQGVTIVAARGERLASVRMYDGLTDIWQGFSKNASASLAYRGSRAGLTVLSTILSGLAIPAAIYGLLTNNLPFELAAVVAYVTSVAELLVWQYLFETPVSAALWQPLAMVTFLAIALDSVFRRTHTWKGRPV